MKLYKNKSNRMFLRIKQKQVGRRIIIISGISIISLSLALTLYFQFVNIEKAFAASNYYSLADGDWATSVWSNTNAAGSNCGCNPGGNFNKTAYISKRISVSTYAPFKMSGGGVVNIIAGGKITFNTDVELNGGSLMTIDSLDTVIVNGNLLVSSSNIDVKGYFRVNGNATLTGGSTVCGTGFALLNGNLSGSTWCGGIVLPISLLYFNAVENGDHVKFNWATASEINNDYFTVERSADGVNFEQVLTMKGAGNSTHVLDYTANEKNQSSDVSYYRLKQTDYDGKFTYSKIESVKKKSLERSSGLTINSIVPNPFSNNFTIDFSVPKPTEILVTLTKFTGQIINQEKITANEGSNTYNYTCQQKLSSGSYIVRLISGDEVVSKKIIKE